MFFRTKRGVAHLADPGEEDRCFQNKSVLTLLTQVRRTDVFQNKSVLTLLTQVRRTDVFQNKSVELLTLLTQVRRTDVFQNKSVLTLLTQVRRTDVFQNKSVVAHLADPGEKTDAFHNKSVLTLWTQVRRRSCSLTASCRASSRTLSGNPEGRRTGSPLKEPAGQEAPSDRAERTTWNTVPPLGTGEPQGQRALLLEEVLVQKMGNSSMEPMQ
ncbi:Axonemal 84 kDa protein [Dissostichus eleginoides]|uniref:Axonemal 84 kDa protein n=1 Tax=Dissostichus eleginoides TaxID=100907 RepID=A0AAD9B3Q9_DISEL|nr:Axonemal 84 kDa protein [Dissostichus eleginoides]